jgi:hypothetical protein
MPASPRFLVVAAIAIGLAAAFSCKTFNLPSETCDPSNFHGGMLPAGLTDSTCNRCLEDQCCQKVGICERTPGCADLVSSVHACVLDAGLAGAQDEMGCADNPTRKLGQIPAADDAYRCMRDSCGNECGLPVCKVDRAAVLIQTADCDSCFSSSCCSQLNACYASRACKLTIECIINACGPKLGDSLAGAPLSILAGLDGGALDFCGDGGAALGRPGAMEVPACVKDCVCAFRQNDQGLAPSDPTQKPERLSLDVYVCGQQANCGTRCPRSVDQATDAAPEAASDAGADAPSDAGADAP